MRPTLALATSTAAALIWALPATATPAPAMHRPARAALASSGSVPGGFPTSGASVSAASRASLSAATPGLSGGPAPMDDASASAPASSGDPLGRNGFDSPLCRNPRLRAQLDADAQANCRTASFVAAGSPTGNYGFDVHIDTGIVPDGNTLAMWVQDILLTPAWTALVWIVHALIVAVEWCYSLDLLDGSTLGAVSAALGAAQQTFTQPWLAAVMAVASIAALYHGVVRRRVAETLGEFLLMLAMMGAGLWVIMDPAATVGSLNRWENDSSLGAVGAISAGSPSRAGQSLASGMADLFAEVVGAPWCYLEFGEVNWCRDPARLDPRLRTAAERLTSSHASGVSAQLVHEAKTNGDLFLAFAADGPARNSINDPGSLLHVLCGSYDTTRCRGPTAAQAEFRTASGTWPRVGGLLLIAVGAVGMIALFAFIALRLLGAAVGALLYLLLAPAAVLAPALGEAGRRAFRGWASRLLGALLAKLLYSVFLGVLLLVLHVLDGLGNLGWWTQWTLVAVLWWTAWGHRHDVLRFAALGHRETGARGIRLASALMATRELSRLTGAGRVLRHPRIRQPPDLPSPTPPSPPRPTSADDNQLDRVRDSQRRERAVVRAQAPAARRRRGADRVRLDRIQREQAAARRSGDARRTALLGVRAQRLAEQMASDEALLGQRRSAARAGARIDARWLDAQARLPSARHRARPAGRRDYQTLAGLASLTPSAYRDLDPARQRSARLAIDRELDRRAAVLGERTARSPAPHPAAARTPRPEALQSGRGPRRSTVPPESVVLRRERQFAAWRATALGRASAPEHDMARAGAAAERSASRSSGPSRG